MAHTHVKGHGQSSLNSKVKVETDERTDGDDCITGASLDLHVITLTLSLILTLTLQPYHNPKP